MKMRGFSHKSWTAGWLAKICHFFTDLTYEFLGNEIYKSIAIGVFYDCKWPQEGLRQSFNFFFYIMFIKEATDDQGRH